MIRINYLMPTNIEKYINPYSDGIHMCIPDMRLYHTYLNKEVILVNGAWFR